MPVLKNPEPGWSAVQIKRVAVQVIERAYKIHIRRAAHELRHEFELVRQIEVIVLSKVNKFGVFLLQQDFNLSIECPMVADSWQRLQHKVLCRKNAAEHIGVAGRAAIQKHPYLGAQI